MDGDRSDSVTFSTRGHQWDQWELHPANQYGLASAAAKGLSTNEGHFYMECSNRGLCNRKTGECECFEPYEGSGCQRITCPNDCSGHGTCERIQELADAESVTYQLWDGIRLQGCKCDYRWQGADCSERRCPYGDDPLMTDATGYEVQTVTSTDCDNADLDGTFKLKFTDVWGEVWTTASINTAIYSTGVKTTLETDMADALTKIPNDIVEEVTVVASASGTNGVTYTITFTKNPGNINSLSVHSVATTGTGTCASSATTFFTVATSTSGGNEEIECSNRGVCDRSSATCKCFKGYTADDCSVQNALAV